MLSFLFVLFCGRAFAAEQLPRIHVQSTYHDDSTGEDVQIHGQGVLIDFFGTPMIVTSSHLTQGGTAQGHVTGLKVTYEHDGQFDDLPITLHIADNLSDVAMLFSEKAFGLSPMAKARYQGWRTINHPYELSLVMEDLNYDPTILEFPLVGKYREQFEQMKAREALQLFYPLGRQMFTPCPDNSPTFCAGNSERWARLTELSRQSLHDSYLGQRIFRDGFLRADGEGVVFTHLLPGMSGQMVVNYAFGDPQLEGIVSTSSLNTNESWFTLMSSIGPTMAEMPAILARDPGREFYLRHNVFWKYEGGYLSRFVPPRAGVASFSESRPVTTFDVGTEARMGLGNHFRGDNGDLPQTPAERRSLPIRIDADGKAVQTLDGFYLGSKEKNYERRHWSGLLPPTIGGLRREIIELKEDAGPLRAEVFRSDFTRRFPPAINGVWKMKLNLDAINFKKMTSQPDRAHATLEVLESVDPNVAIHAHLDFLDDQVDVTLFLGEPTHVARQNQQLRPFVDVITANGRTCSLETSGLIFENPDRLNVLDRNFVSIFQLVCGDENFYFTRLRPNQHPRPHPHNQEADQ